jgi:hypothetical protein
MRALWLFFLVACSEHGHTPAADAPDTPPPSDAASETQALGMNDVSMILPTMFAGLYGKMNGIDGTGDLVPRDLYTRLVTSHGDVVRTFDDFLIFGIRFDLCNRVALGPCPQGADGSLRIVFQPMMPQAVAADAGLHAFYTIPAADLGFVVTELRAIARLTGTGPLLSSPLQDQHVSLLAGIPRLKALVAKYAVPQHLIQLTMMGQDSRSATPRVVFRGLELRGGQMVDIAIPTLTATEQAAALTDVDPSYTVTPVADAPAGFVLAMSSAAFNSAPATDQRAAVDALVAAENPRLHTASTVQCVACHVSTYLDGHRATIAGIDRTALPSAFSTTRNVDVSGGVATTNEHSLHAFSWMGSSVAISRRVANETAVVLDEIEQRFPAAQ